MPAQPPQGIHIEHVVGSNAALIFGGTNAYNAIYGSLWDGVEADMSIIAPHSGRVVLIRAKATGNSTASDVTVSLRIGGATQSGGAVISAGVNEEEDSTAEAPFAKGDVINFAAIGGTSGSLGLHFLAIVIWEND